MARIATIFTALRGVIYATAFVMLWAWLALLIRAMDSKIPVSLPQWLCPLGFAFVIAGGLLVVSCISVFITRGHGTPAPFDAPRLFVASGPYRYVRNPMYVGAISVLMGAGLLLRSPAIIILAFIFFVIAHVFVVVYEEPTLKEKFGESYQLYQSSVSRWIIKTPMKN